ncbi:MAG TPA: flagellar motor protein MotB [Dongiaceae bacterium]|nr:flagellar motor protein MotB [Dongiaceae bacterium]
MDPDSDSPLEIALAKRAADAARKALEADAAAREVLGAEIELDYTAAAMPAEPPAVAIDPVANDVAGEAPEALPPPGAEGRSENLGSGGAPIPRWTRPPPAPIKPPSEARNPSLPTFVGLIMLILTFFIVLTSISLKDRDKSDAAMASLQDAFSGTVETAQRAEDADMNIASRDFMRGLTGQIQSLIPLMGGKKSSPAEHQVLWLPLSLAFADNATEMQPAFSPVLQELLNASEKIPPRFDYQVEVRLCAAAPSDAMRRRAMSLAAALDTLQAPLDRFAIGTQDCQADRIGFAVAMAPIGPAPISVAPMPVDAAPAQPGEPGANP